VSQPVATHSKDFQAIPSVDGGSMRQAMQHGETGARRISRALGEGLTQSESRRKYAIRTWSKLKMLFTLADLTRFTGAKRRSVQLWAEAGAIAAESDTERAGAGVHRLFSRDEVVVACVVAAFALDNVPIGVLIHVGGAIRGMLVGGFRYELGGAIRNERKCFFIYDQRKTPLFISPFTSRFVTIPGRPEVNASKTKSEIDEYIANEMDDTNVKANIIYLNGCFARIRNNPDFLDW
jgi:hypothetical protein